MIRAAASAILLRSGFAAPGATFCFTMVFMPQVCDPAPLWILRHVF